MPARREDQDGTCDLVTQSWPHAAQSQRWRTNPGPLYSELMGAIASLLHCGQWRPLPELSLQASGTRWRARNR